MLIICYFDGCTIFPIDRRDRYLPEEAVETNNLDRESNPGTLTYTPISSNVKDAYAVNTKFNFLTNVEIFSCTQKQFI